MAESLAGVPESLAGLVQRYSPSGEETEAAAWLAQHLPKIGYAHSEIDAVGNVIGLRGTGHNQLILLGHIDTVSGEIPVRLEGDLFFGRGSVDAKGPLACFIEAAARVQPGPDWQIRVVAAVGEEADSRGAWHLAKTARADALIVGEPSRWDCITLGYKGSISFRLLREKDQAHSAGREGSAADDLLSVWQRILDAFEALNLSTSRAFDQVLPTVRNMVSDNDGFRAWARMDVQVRLPEAHTPDHIQALLERICGEHAISIEILGRPIPAHRASKNTSLVKAFLRSIRGQSGTPRFKVKTGTADLNIVAPIWNCPAVVYGPGDSGLDHTPNEHLSLTEFAQAVDVLAGVLIEITAGKRALPN
jgi:LysW-gamma-L-lysine carboxypeptidase